MYNETVSFLKKEVQDFCLLQTEKIEGNQYILGFHSVKNEICPPVKDIARGVVSFLLHCMVFKKCFQ